jgi:hypothetical protein
MARKRSPAREVGPLMIATERPAAPFLRIVEEAAGYGLFEVLHSLVSGRAGRGSA